MKMEQKTIAPIKVGGEKYSQIFRQLRKLPLEERIDIDWQRAAELGHEPKRLFRKGLVTLYARNLLPEHLTKPDRFGGRALWSGEGVVHQGKRIIDKYRLNVDDVKAVQLKAYEDWMAEGCLDIAMRIAIAGKLGDDKIKAAALPYYKYYLKKLNYDDAKKIADDAGLTPVDIQTVALQTCEEIMRGGYDAKDHRGKDTHHLALEIAEHFGLGQDMITRAAWTIFYVNYEKGQIYDEGYFYDAISIARKYRLRDDLVITVARNTCNQMIRDCDLNGVGYFAAQRAEEFELGKELITKAALAEYDACMRRGEFTSGYNCSAIFIAEKYDLGGDKVMAAAQKAFEQEMSYGCYEKAVEIAEKYGLDKALLKSAKTLAEIAKNK
jgi:hypothetical protein